MFLRIFSGAIIAAALTACGSEAETQAPDGPVVQCAIGPGSDFSGVCTFERVSSGEFVIHHPDGGFRRFALTDDPSAPLGVADGAEPITFEQSGDGSAGDEADILQFGLTVDRYRIDKGLIAPSTNE